VIESCEPCATCGEVTPHSRRGYAPLRWLAAATGLLAALLAVAAVARTLPLACPASLASALLVLAVLRADRARRWDLACTRCHLANSDAVQWPTPAYMPDCAGCHFNDYRPGVDKHNGIAADRNCASSGCHRITEREW